jgi:protease-4
MPPWMGGPPMFRPPRPGGAFLRIVLALLALVILIDLVILNLGILGGLASAAQSSHARKVTLVSSVSEQTIAVVPVEGLIDDDMAKQFDELLSAVSDDRTVKAVVLAVDTPGGSASSSDAMYHRLQVFKADAKKRGDDIPIIASMGGMGTSGGYYVSCGADYIFAEPATLTANIGVLFPRFNVSKFLNDHGVQETTIVASGCDYKNLGSMFSPEDEKGRAYLQGLVDGTFDQFKHVVLEGRHNLPADKSNIFNGRVYMAPDALKLGLIDAIGYNEDAYDYAKKAANISDAKVVRYEPAPYLQRLLGADSLSNITGGQTQNQARTFTVNGVSFDVTNLTDLLAPRPMYLWMGN